MSQAPSASATPQERQAGGFETEPTEAGLQCLIGGVAPISLADRLRQRAAAPLEPSRPQRACDLGLFDLNARLQLDLFSKLPPGTPDG